MTIPLTCIAYTPKKGKMHNGKAIGIDLVIKNQITFSNVVKVNYAVSMSDKTKKFYKAFSKSDMIKKQKRSKRRIKILQKINKEFSH
ncbi:MAG: hypothetical protein QW478_05365 [Candidatus Micrarchaeaceae archaeon]